jgi:hypothetical protein
MPADFLHRHKDFKALLAIVSEERGILPGLVEKDYWIKHVLYSMTKLELEFELKGGTYFASSKAHHVQSDPATSDWQPGSRFEVRRLEIRVHCTLQRHPIVHA